MKKRIFSALLCAAMLVSLAPAAFAAETAVPVAEAAQVLAALDVMTGDETGTLHLERNVTRAEFTKLTLAASAYRESVGPTASVSPYPDVPKNNWAAPWIQAAKEKSLVKGNLSGYFEPGRDITLAEGATMALRLLGYQDSDFTGAWPSGQMALYRTLKLDKGVSAPQDGPMARQDALYLFYNLMTAKTKAGQVYLVTLGHTLTASGEIDRVALVNSAMEGPLVAEGAWQSALPFAATTVYRGGAAAEVSAIRPGDVVYYSGPMRTLWAYTNKVTGAIQKLTPTASAPTAVTVGGQSYALETTAAAYSLSDLGTFRAGDTVTLLLGRNGGVAAVRLPGEMGSTTYGIVAGVATAAYQDADGKAYSANTVTLTATDGSTYSYRWEEKNKTLEAGDMVRVTAQADGTAIRKLTKTPLTGKVSADGSKVGNTPFAGDVEILDTYGKTALLRVYPGRLAGVTLGGDMVRYYRTNEQGEISHMILSDVTGEIHRYGVLTEVEEKTIGMAVVANYTYDIGGTVTPFVSKSSIWNLKTGPCVVKMDGKTVERIQNLTEVAITGIDGNKALTANKTYTLSDSPAVYELRDKKYYLADLAHVTAGGYTLSGWQDKAENEGGRIRVIVAKAD